MVETTYVTKDNRKIPVLVSISSLQNVEGHEGMIHAVTDIGEIKILKEELFQSEKMSLLGKLAGEIAHEINNPLSGLIMATQMLIEDCSIGRIDMKELRKELQGIESDAKRCKGFIEKVLNFSRMIPEERRILNVNDTVEEALMLVRRQAKVANISIAREYTSADLSVWGNSNSIQQVIINIVNNSCDALSPAGGSIGIRTYGINQKHKRLAVIEINDTGPGIPEGIMGRLFDSFFTTREKGTGLGLSVSKRIIEEHGGTIRVSNRETGGASFVITLPRRQRGSKDEVRSL